MTDLESKFYCVHFEGLNSLEGLEKLYSNFEFLIKCDECGEYSNSLKWEDDSVFCDSCGDHSALVCPKCYEVHDIVYTTFNHKKLGRVL